MNECFYYVAFPFRFLVVQQLCFVQRAGCCTLYVPAEHRVVAHDRLLVAKCRRRAAAAGRRWCGRSEHRAHVLRRCSLWHHVSTCAESSGGSAILEAASVNARACFSATMVLFISFAIATTRSFNLQDFAPHPLTFHLLGTPLNPLPSVNLPLHTFILVFILLTTFSYLKI